MGLDRASMAVGGEWYGAEGIRGAFFFSTVLFAFIWQSFSVLLYFCF